MPKSSFDIIGSNHICVDATISFVWGLFISCVGLSYFVLFWAMIMSLRFFFAIFTCVLNFSTLEKPKYI